MSLADKPSHPCESGTGWWSAVGHGYINTELSFEFCNQSFEYYKQTEF